MSFLQNWKRKPRTLTYTLPAGSIRFRKWWLDNTQTEVLLTPAEILYGVIQKCKHKELLNHTLLITKYFIYKCSLREESLYFPLFEHEEHDKSTKEKKLKQKTLLYEQIPSVKVC